SEMGRRLVTYPHGDPLRDEFRQRRPAAFAPRELVHRLIDLLADQAESPQEVAHYLLGRVGVVVRPDSADDGFGAVERFEVLIVITELDEVALLNRTAIGLFLAE